MGGDIASAVEEVRAKGLIVISLNMAGSVPDMADLVVSDPVQAGVMAVMAVAVGWWAWQARHAAASGSSVDAASGLSTWLHAGERSATAPSSTMAATPAPAATPVSLEAVPDIEVSEISHDQELDEAVIAFANADFGMSEEILRRLKAVMKGRTSIIISHRISTVKHADLIIVLDKGAIAERGTHDELVARGGIYADLYEQQLLEEELDHL